MHYWKLRNIILNNYKHDTNTHKFHLVSESNEASGLTYEILKILVKYLNNKYSLFL